MIPIFIPTSSEGLSVTQESPRLRMLFIALVLLAVYMTLPYIVVPLVLFLPILLNFRVDSYLVAGPGFLLAAVTGIGSVVTLLMELITSERTRWWHWTGFSALVLLAIFWMPLVGTSLHEVSSEYQEYLKLNPEL